MPRRRILEKLKITELSGVDRPCQAGALVTIMKRAPDEDDRVDALLIRTRLLKRKADQLEKFDINQARDTIGRWSRTGAAAVMRATSATLGRAFRVQATAGRLPLLRLGAGTALAAGAVAAGVGAFARRPVAEPFMYPVNTVENRLKELIDEKAKNFNLFPRESKALDDEIARLRRLTTSVPSVPRL